LSDGLEGKSSVPDVQTVLQTIVDDSRFSVVPLNREGVERLHRAPVVRTTNADPLKDGGLDVLPEKLPLSVAITELHDQLIVVTTLLLIDVGEHAVLVTNDAAIVASDLLPTLW